MGTLVPDGYNLREGGGNGKPSEESKRKMSEARLGDKNYMYGKIHTDETKQKISEVHIGKTLSEEHKKKLGKARMGKTHTEETKQRMREAQLGEKHPRYGKIHTGETKQKMSEARLGEKNYKSRRVYQYALDGTFVDSFGSCGEAERHLKKCGSSIRACANDKRKTAYGFKWSYTILNLRCS
jgi:hypothetical protein